MTLGAVVTATTYVAGGVALVMMISVAVSMMLNSPCGQPALAERVLRRVGPFLIASLIATGLVHLAPSALISDVELDGPQIMLGVLIALACVGAGLFVTWLIAKVLRF